MILIAVLAANIIQDRPLPVPLPPPPADRRRPQPLADPSGWFVASDPFGPSAVLQIKADGDGWRARFIMHPTTAVLGQTWCDMTANASADDVGDDGVRFTAEGASIDAGPRWSPEMTVSPSFGVAVYEREAIITDMGSGQAMCGPRSELTGVYSRMPD